MKRACGALLVLASIVALGGCGPRQIGYQPNGQTTEIEYGTGDTIISQYWLYDDGHTDVTFKRIPRGNTDRRRDAPPPAARFAAD